MMKREPAATSPGVRLQKFMADCGTGSRRRCEEMIAAGRVRVNGEVITQPGTRVDVENDKVTVDGAPILPSAIKVYYMLHKPRGYIVSAGDPQGRKTVYDLIDGIPERVVPVGRLDLDSEGLLLLTNDGELTFRLMHPRYLVEKEYEVTARGFVADSELDRLRSGIEIESGKTQPAHVTILRRGNDETTARITITEGKKRQVRLMFQEVGHPVLRLRRVREGIIRLGTLKPGQFRKLTVDEIQELKHEVGL